MSTRLKEKQEKVQQTLSKLVEASAKGRPVVVEGKKDEQALRELGVCCRLVWLECRPAREKNHIVEGEGGVRVLELVTENHHWHLHFKRHLTLRVLYTFGFLDLRLLTRTC